MVTGKSIARHHQIVEFRMNEDCCEDFRERGGHAHGDLPDDLETTATVSRETGREVLGVPSQQIKDDKEA